MDSRIRHHTLDMNVEMAFVTWLQSTGPRLHVSSTCPVRRSQFVPNLMVGRFRWRSKRHRLLDVHTRTAEENDLVDSVVDGTAAKHDLFSVVSTSSSTVFVDADVFSSLSNPPATGPALTKAAVDSSAVKSDLDAKDEEWKSWIPGTDGLPIFKKMKKVYVKVGTPHTEESKRKISAANKGNTPWNKGKKHSAETRRRIAEATRRAMSRPEVRERLRELARQRTHSSKTKVKIAQTRLRSRVASTLRKASIAWRSSSGMGEYLEVTKSLRSVFRRTGRTPSPFQYPSEVITELNQRVMVRKDDMKDDDAKPKKPVNSLVKRSMPESTRAKLSARIKELWADPEYRLKVSKGVQMRMRETSNIKRSLSEEHKQRIRATLLRRNAEQRAKNGVPSPAPRPTRSRRLRKENRSESGSGRVNSSAPHKGNNVSRPSQKAVRDQSEQGTVLRRFLRKGRTGRLSARAREAKRRAAEERLRSQMLLSSLASAGQLPSLNEEAVLSSTVGFSPYTADSATSQNGAVASDEPLLLSVDRNSCTDSASAVDFGATSEGLAAEDAGNARMPDDSTAFRGPQGLDYDIYEPMLQSPYVEEYDETYDEDVFSRKKKGMTSHALSANDRENGRRRRLRTAVSAANIDDSELDFVDSSDNFYDSNDGNAVFADREDSFDGEYSDDGPEGHAFDRSNLTENDPSLTTLPVDELFKDDEECDKQILSTFADGSANVAFENEAASESTKTTPDAQSEIEGSSDILETQDRTGFSVNRLATPRKRPEQQEETSRIVTYVNGEAVYLE